MVVSFIVVVGWILLGLCTLNAIGLSLWMLFVSSKEKKVSRALQAAIESEEAAIAWAQVYFLTR